MVYRYITNNKEADNDWFRLESNKEGTRWFGKCWHYHNQVYLQEAYHEDFLKSTSAAEI